MKRLPYEKRFPEKYAAHKAVRKIPCQKGLERHHWSYATENHLDFILLTLSQHKRLHAKMSYDQDKRQHRDKKGRLLTKQDHIDLLYKLCPDFNHVLEKATNKLEETI